MAQASSNGAFLMVGYNRRFAEPITALKAHFRGITEPLAMLYRVNAGFLPHDNWTQADSQGGRILGEMCHFVDTLQFLCGATPVSVYAAGVGDRSARYNTDNVSVEITFDDGSVGTILYLANGAPAMAKEYLEVFGGGRSAEMDNFKSLRLYNGRKTEKKSYSGDKGHAAEVEATVQAVKTGESPIALASLIATSKVCFAAIESLRTRSRIDLE